MSTIQIKLFLFRLAMGIQKMWTKQKCLIIYILHLLTCANARQNRFQNWIWMSKSPLLVETKRKTTTTVFYNYAIVCCLWWYQTTSDEVSKCCFDLKKIKTGQLKHHLNRQFKAMVSFNWNHVFRCWFHSNGLVPINLSTI